MNEIERVVLKYLEERPEDWKWVRSTKVFTKTETIKLFKKDKKFRKLICEQVVKLATDLFIRGAKE